MVWKGCTDQQEEGADFDAGRGDTVPAAQTNRKNELILMLVAVSRRGQTPHGTCRSREHQERSVDVWAHCGDCGDQSHRYGGRRESTYCLRLHVRKQAPDGFLLHFAHRPIVLIRFNPDSYIVTKPK